ncbi:MAG TPA: hypothetical protein VLF93_02120 [Candidatus Saccharimonadales bacterium]|nr:hypothetical protein [Candidatus Saccharimonadales bacterium]
MKFLQKHFWHYLVYFLIFGIGFLLVLSERGNGTIQALYLVLIGMAYFAWAMVHHYVHHELTSRIIIEYVLIVILGIVLSLFLFGI